MKIAFETNNSSEFFKRVKTLTSMRREAHLAELCLTSGGATLNREKSLKSFADYYRKLLSRKKFALPFDKTFGTKVTDPYSEAHIHS